MDDNTGACKSCDKLADEIERLRTEVGQWGRACSSYVEVLAAQDADLKRLRGFALWILDTYEYDEWPAQKDIVAGAREALGNE